MVCPMLNRACDNREDSPILIVVVAILTYKSEISEEALRLKIMVWTFIILCEEQKVLWVYQSSSIAYYLHYADIPSSVGLHLILLTPKIWNSSIHFMQCGKFLICDAFPYTNLHKVSNCLQVQIQVKVHLKVDVTSHTMQKNANEIKSMMILQKSVSVCDSEYTSIESAIVCNNKKNLWKKEGVKVYKKTYNYINKYKNTKQ